MAKINLLPWREELRKKRQQDFLIAMGAGVGVTCVLFLIVYLHIEALKDYQTQRNARLDTEITEVNKKIKEISDLEEKRSKLIEKINLIRELQASRPKIVHLFDELRKVTPVGIYISSLAQKGAEITINGKSDSEPRVSEFMRNIEASQWLTNPVLKFVKKPGGAANLVKGEANEFTMIFKQKEDKPKDDEDDPENKLKSKIGGK